MSIDVDTRPLGLKAATDEGELTHIVCCDPNVALCSEDVEDSTWVGPDDDYDCIVCCDLWDRRVACGRPFCWLRSRWRDRRWPP